MVKINFLGDISIFDFYEKFKIDPFKEVELPVGDFTVANLESCFIPKCKPFHGQTPSLYYSSKAYVDTLHLNKINLFGLANNHISDYGITGYLELVEFLDNKQIPYFGAGIENYNFFSKNIGGISFLFIGASKLGMQSAAANNFCPDKYDNKLYEEIHKNRSRYDHIILFLHWGSELNNIPSPVDVSSARQFIDAGASAVVGHHPHICQGMEVYNQGVIAYSLGSFIYPYELEIGYSYDASLKREYSFCLQIEFSKDKIIAINDHWYQNDKLTNIPKLIDKTTISELIDFLNRNIENKRMYRKNKIKLFKREIKALKWRFLTNPFSTLCHYSGYIKYLLFRSTL